MLENEHDRTPVACQDNTGVAWSLASPRTGDELAGLLELAGRQGDCVVVGMPGAIPARFKGRRFQFVDLSHLSAVLEHCREDQVVSVETGITLAQLDSLLSEEKQWWPVSTFDRSTKVVDVINRAEGGCLEHQFGGPRDLVLGLTAALSTGDLIACGGKVVKNVTGYDLQKLFIGSHGWLGAVCRAHLRLFARPETSRSLSCSVATVDEAFAVFGSLMRSGVPLSCLELVSGGVLELIAESQDLTRLAAADAESLRRAPYAVLIQLHGKAAIVDQIEVEVRNRLNSAQGRVASLNVAEAELLWAKLSDLKAACSLSKLELSLGCGQMADLLKFLSAQNLEYFWQARPSRGRLQLFSKQQEFIEALQEKVRQRATQTNQAIVMASSDSNFDWRVVWLPNAEEEAVALKQALKSRFDPSGCLNPLVEL